MARKSLKDLVNLIEAETEQLPKEQAFLNDLKKSIEMTEEKHRRKPSQFYKPSSMNCMRESYYQITGQEPTDIHESYSGIGICNSGTDTHLRIQNYVIDMQENGIDCEWVDVEKYIKSRELNYLDVISKTGTEVKLLHKTFNMHFMCDGIIKYKNHYYVLELKTESSNKFFRRDGVDPKHHAQATAYSVSFNLDDVIFVYISRDTLDMKSFLLTVTEDMKSKFIGYIENCDDYIRHMKVPPKSDNKYSCMYCQYSKQCRKDG